MRRHRLLHICFCVTSFLLFSLSAQDAAPKAESAEQTKTAAESKAKSTDGKSGQLDDFEKQLQKELEGTPDRAPIGEQPSIAWQFIRTLITLAFLLAIFYGVFRLYKFRRSIPAQSFNAVSSIYEFPLGTNQRLQIIELAGRLMVLGVSENSIQLISEITDKYTIDRIKLDCAEDSKQPRTDFMSELSRAIKVNLTERFGKKNTQNFSDTLANSTAENLETQRQSSLERLRKLKSDKFDWREKP